MTVLTWSDDRVESLKKLWEAGLSCSQIAAELGSVTRNAVIGKIHRLGLGGRAKSPSSAAPRKRKARPQQHTMRTARPKSKLAAAFEIVGGTDYDDSSALEAAVESRRVSLMDLTESNCHWPIGTPGAEDFCFCGNGSLTGLPYCSGHCRLAYRPAADRRAHA